MVRWTPTFGRDEGLIYLCHHFGIEPLKVKQVVLWATPYHYVYRFVGYGVREGNWGNPLPDPNGSRVLAEFTVDSLVVPS